MLYIYYQGTKDLKMHIYCLLLQWKQARPRDNKTKTNREQRVPGRNVDRLNGSNTKSCDLPFRDDKSSTQHSWSPSRGWAGGRGVHLEYKQQPTEMLHDIHENKHMRTM